MQVLLKHNNGDHHRRLNVAAKSPKLPDFQKQASAMVLGLVSLLPQAPTKSQFIAHQEIAQRFLRIRHTFRSKGKPILIKVGFHYTYNKDTADGIQRRGLKRSKTTYFGEGVYLSENPHAFSMFGDTGILVLYIPGTVQHLGNAEKTDSHRNADSYRGNKLTTNTTAQKKVQYFDWAKSPYFDEIILKEESQALPVFAFPRSAVNCAEQLHSFHQKVQELVDRFLNYPEDYAPEKKEQLFPPRKTIVRRICPSIKDFRYEHKLYKKHRGRFEEENRLVFSNNGKVLAKAKSMAKSKAKSNAKSNAK